MQCLRPQDSRPDRGPSHPAPELPRHKARNDDDIHQQCKDVSDLKWLVHALNRCVPLSQLRSPPKQARRIEMRSLRHRAPCSLKSLRQQNQVAATAASLRMIAQFRAASMGPAPALECLGNLFSMRTGIRHFFLRSPEACSRSSHAIFRRPRNNSRRTLVLASPVISAISRCE